jgi:hypothetical protein
LYTLITLADNVIGMIGGDNGIRMATGIIFLRSDIVGSAKYFPTAYRHREIK